MEKRGRGVCKPGESYGSVLPSRCLLGILSKDNVCIWYLRWKLYVQLAVGIGS